MKKMRIYKLFKQNFGIEPYLEDTSDKKNKQKALFFSNKYSQIKYRTR